MNELDCVRLIKPFKGMEVGTRGVIVLKYNDEDFEVEYFTNNHETIDVYLTNIEYLELEIPWHSGKS